MKTIMSEKKIDSNFFKIKLGTLDKKNPTTLYIDAGTYIKPSTHKDNYKSDIINIEKSLKLQTKQIFKTIPGIKDDFILVTDISVSRISPERNTHFTVQVYFKPDTDEFETKKTFKELCKDYIQQYSECFNIYRQIIEEYGFTCSKTK